ncbi:MAG TPA: Gfo/Idh/MocA family oxidoreductase [Tepidisphaeraceae bacterium]|nr:Gfo/Idh/MocA family oxidoreductase [Tepidisphaeraceae bacterium]
MDKVRMGVIGLGNMGAFHAGYMDSIAGATLSAVCDVDRARAERACKGGNAAKFQTYSELINSGTVDAILIATPHFQHCEIARAAFAKGLHVLMEKPMAVTIKDARQTIQSHAQAPGLKFGMMFQMRTFPIFRKVRELIAEGELGEISRVTWLITDWFRTWTYYGSGGWRATWAGEGGGVLLNQCPHNLDLLHWLTGMMPSRITAVANIGKTHPIEVEDEVSAILEYPNGAMGQFVTTTGEAPGTNRLEISGDRGKLVVEKGKLVFTRTRKSVREIREKSPEAFATPEAWEIDLPVKADGGDSHKIMTQNFVNGILKDEPLIAAGEEGAKGLEIGNAMLMAGITRQAVELPLDGDAYEQLLKDLTARYGGKKSVQARADAVADINASFKH